jgi:HEAT repeat protein
MNCESARRQILLLVCGELTDSARRDVEGHTRGCPDCAAALAEERRLNVLLTQRPPIEPSTALLDRCRRDLAAAIGESHHGRWAPKRAPAGWRPPRIAPGWAVALAVAGFLAGRFTLGGGLAPIEDREGDASREEAGSSVTHLDFLRNDPRTERVSISYDTLRRTSLEGSARDPRIRRLLLGTLRDSFNAGLRLEAIDALSGHAEEREVRTALLRTLQEDDNAGARLKALDALARRAGKDSDVREAILRTLLRDTNPGVRVKAIDTLGQSRDPGTLPVLRRLAKEDPNDYVRLRSAALAGDLSHAEGG